MNKFLSSVLFLVLAVSVVTGCSKRKDAEHAVATNHPKLVNGVTVEAVQALTFSEKFEVVGTVKARTNAVVSARIPGTISVLKVRESDRVGKGDLLIELDALEHMANVGMTTAAIDVARRGLNEAVARRNLADTIFARYQLLLNEQAVSRQEFEVKQMEKEVASQGVAQAESRLRQAEEAAKAASAMSGYTKILAPVAGTITSKQTDPGATVFPGQPLLTIEGDEYQLELAVPESLAMRIKTGTPVQVRLDALNVDLQSKVAEIVPVTDPGSRTITAKVSLKVPGLKTGMFGRGVIDSGITTTMIALPKKAVMERGALTSIWVLGQDNLAHLRLVKTGKTMGDQVEILSGLTEGERVVTDGVLKITEGARVE